MFFMIRMAFWFALVLLFLPLGTNDPASPGVGPVQAFVAARGALTDLSAFCERQPDVCETGSAALQTITVRASDTARFVYGVIEDKSADSNDLISTGSVSGVAWAEAPTVDTIIADAVAGDMPANVPVPTPAPAQ